MSDKCIGNEKGELSLKYKVLLGALALTVIVGLGSAAYGASDNTDNKTNVLLLKPRGIFILDPFTYKSTLVTVTRSESENESDPGLDTDTLLAEIYVLSAMIPYRAALRSPYRPALRYTYRPALRLPFRPPLILR